MDAIPSAEEEMAQTIDLLAHAVHFFALSQSFRQVQEQTLLATNGIQLLWSILQFWVLLAALMLVIADMHSNYGTVPRGWMPSFELCLHQKLRLLRGYLKLLQGHQKASPRFLKTAGRRPPKTNSQDVDIYCFETIVSSYGPTEEPHQEQGSSNRIFACWTGRASADWLI